MTSNIVLREGKGVWAKWKDFWWPAMIASECDANKVMSREKPKQGGDFVLIFFVETGSHAWCKRNSVLPISHRPSPIHEGSVESGRELAATSPSPRMEMIHRLGWCMLDVYDQLNTACTSSNMQTVGAWQDFATQVWECQTYGELGIQLMKAADLILPEYFTKKWKARVKEWRNRCKRASKAMDIEDLTEFLKKGIDMSKIQKVWDESENQTEDWDNWRGAKWVEWGEREEELDEKKEDAKKMKPSKGEKATPLSYNKFKEIDVKEIDAKEIDVKEKDWKAEHAKVKHFKKMGLTENIRKEDKNSKQKNAEMGSSSKLGTESSKDQRQEAVRGVRKRKKTNLSVSSSEGTDGNGKETPATVNNVGSGTGLRTENWGKSVSKKQKVSENPFGVTGGVGEIEVNSSLRKTISSDVEEASSIKAVNNNGDKSLGKTALESVEAFQRTRSLYTKPGSKDVPREREGVADLGPSIIKISGDGEASHEDGNNKVLGNGTLEHGNGFQENLVSTMPILESVRLEREGGMEGSLLFKSFLLGKINDVEESSNAAVNNKVLASSAPELGVGLHGTSSLPTVIRNLNDAPTETSFCPQEAREPVLNSREGRKSEETIKKAKDNTKVSGVVSAPPLLDPFDSYANSDDSEATVTYSAFSALGSDCDLSSRDI